MDQSTTTVYIVTNKATGESLRMQPHTFGEGYIEFAPVDNYMDGERIRFENPDQQVETLFNEEFAVVMEETQPTDKTDDLPLEDIPEEENSAASVEPAVEAVEVKKYMGKVVVSDGMRTVNEKDYHHIRLEDGTTHDLTNEEYDEKVIVSMQ